MLPRTFSCTSLLVLIVGPDCAKADRHTSAMNAENADFIAESLLLPRARRKPFASPGRRPRLLAGKLAIPRNLKWERPVDLTTGHIGPRHQPVIAHEDQTGQEVLDRGGCSASHGSET